MRLLLIALLVVCVVVAVAALLVLRRGRATSPRPGDKTPRVDARPQDTPGDGGRRRVQRTVFRSGGFYGGGGFNGGGGSL